LLVRLQMLHQQAVEQPTNPSQIRAHVRCARRYGAKGARTRN
jgi:hypothetical protein